MNKKQIKLILKKNIESHIPPTMPVINWDSIPVDVGQTISAAPSRRVEKSFLQLKFVLSVLILLAVAFVSFGLLNRQTVYTPVNPYSNVAYQNTLSVSAVSTISLMPISATTPISINQAVSLVSKLSSNSSVVTIEPYLGMIETVTGQNFGITSVSLASDDPLYESKVILTTMDLVGTELSYTLYFDTTSYSEKNDKIEFVIEGIFLYKSKQFDFIGKKVIDGDQEVLSFKTITNDMNYVESSFKTENDESKYFIKIVENGLIVAQSTIKIDEENENKKIKFEFTDGLDRGKYEFTYDQEDGKNILKIQYETLINNVEDSGQMKVEIKVDPLTSLTSYQIFVKPDGEDEYEYESERKVDKDEDHEEDEEQHLEEDED